MLKCELGAFGAGPPKSLDLRGVGNPGQKRPPYIKSMMISGAVVITVIYVYLLYIYMYLYICIIMYILYHTESRAHLHGMVTPPVDRWVVVVVVMDHQNYIYTIHVITPPMFTIEPENHGFQRNLLFQGLIVRFHVKPQRSTHHFLFHSYGKNIFS